MFVHQAIADGTKKHVGDVFAVNVGSSCLCIEASASGLHLMPCKSGYAAQLFNAGNGDGTTPITVGASSTCVSGGEGASKPLVYAQSCSVGQKVVFVPPF
jgi:hypothetical protein